MLRINVFVCCFRSPACLCQTLEIPGPFETNPDLNNKWENDYTFDFPKGKFGYKNGTYCYIAKSPPGENYYLTIFRGKYYYIAIFQEENGFPRNYYATQVHKPRPGKQVVSCFKYNAIYVI